MMNFKYVRIQGQELAENTMYAKGIFSMCWQLERYNHPYYLVYTNTPGEIVYEDKYQVAVKVPGELIIEKLQKSWSPEEE